MTVRRLPSALVAALKSAAGAVALGLLALLLVAGSLASPAAAMQPIVISPDQERIEITTLGDLYEGRGDSLQLETAAGADGLVGRMSVSAATPGTNPNWMVFALTNPTDKPIERWLTADRYNVIGSGAVWPDLDARRIEEVTPSVGFVPERIKSDRADVFRITLEPGQTITYVAELSSERFARIYLWRPLDYELKIADRQLFNGVMLGLTGLMAIFLTAIFAANHKLVFPASALVAWCALAYLCVDFGFFHKLFQMKPEGNAVYRAAAEAALAASLVVFLHVFLRLALWHGLIRMLITVWLLFQLSLIAVAVIDPRLAATFARLSFLGIGAIGAGLIMYLALRGQDRALSLIPTWILFLVWIFGAAVTLTGRLSGDVVVSGLVSGLVLILLLIGFTVTQYAFRSVEPMYGAAPNELQTRAAALDGAGAAVWEWNARRDEIKVSAMVEAALGLNPGELTTRVEGFLKHLHPADRERFRLALWGVQERNDAKIHSSFRLRQADNSYRWYELEAAGLPGTDPRSFKCVGLMRDVTNEKRSQERLLHDAVRCSLTGLANRTILHDRLEVAMTRAKSEPQVRPAVISIDIDKFKSVNNAFGLVLGDSLLLTVARRLQRHLGSNDTLARIGGDEFAILFVAEQPAQELAAHAERIRRSLRSPIKIAGQEIVLTASLGVAAFDGTEAGHGDLFRRAEIAMYRAKRAGADRVEIYTPDMRTDRDERAALEVDLRKAIEGNKLRLLYQPIIYLPTEELAGFEALVRWDRPDMGAVDPTSIIPDADDSDLIVKLGSHVLMRAVRDAATWQKELPRAEHPLFVSVNVASRQLFRQDLIQEIRHILGRNILPKGCLKLEVTEQLVMENPEQATEILEWLRGAGADLSLDSFGAGHSSLAFLDRLPFDTLKLDRALLQSAGVGSGANSGILRAMVAMAHELGKRVVAEGVEQQSEVGFLRSIGCEYAQGFYYGEPVAEADVVALLKMVRRSETKLQPRGFFRMKPKKKTSKPAATASREAPATAALPAPPSAANGSASPPAVREAPRNVAALPKSSVRPRTRSLPPPARTDAPPGVAPRRAASALPEVAAVPALPPNPLLVAAVAAGAPSQPTMQAEPPPGPQATQLPSPPPPHMAPPAPQGPPPQMAAGGPPPLTLVPPPANGADEPTAPPPLPFVPRPRPESPAAAQPQPRAPMPPQMAGPPPPMPPPPPAEAPRAPPPRAPAAGPPPREAAVQPPPAAPARMHPDFSSLPPNIAESLARLAGTLDKPSPRPQPGPPSPRRTERSDA